MHNYQKILDLTDELIASVEARDSLSMQQKIDALELAYKEEFGDSLGSFAAMRAFVKMNLASARYFAHNNMFSLVHACYNDVQERMDGFLKYSPYNKEQKAEVKSIFRELEKVHKATPEKHQNMVVGRYDTRCCLCRTFPANKTGSHMVPNFLAHPTFAWDGKGKRDHEALNHYFLNSGERNCTFYGREVPDWRFAKGEGKEEVSEEDIEKNINQLMYDNEFCSRCEDRFGILETAYSRYYNGQVISINPRTAYLFWLSVLWRMSMGSMSIFMDMNDELSLRKLLDDSMFDTAEDTEGSNIDLGEWKYAIFRADGLWQGDKGILGYRKPCAPYVVMYNDLVMVFYHSNPSDAELTIGPITVQREMLNDWKNPEKSVKVNRRWFWNVRDWFVESSYEFYDPAKEKVLITIREKERSEGIVIEDNIKDEAIKVGRLKYGPRGTQLRLRKIERIYGAWIRKKEAEEKGDEYDPLKDEELFLQQRDFDMYYHDLAIYSQHEEYHNNISKFPFYEQARQAIPDEREWEVHKTQKEDKEFREAMKEYMDDLSPNEIADLLWGVQESYVNPYASIGRNAPCPCGSGKKFKHCHGK